MTADDPTRDDGDASELDDPIDALVAEYLSARERGSPCGAGDFVRAHPEHEPALGIALRAALDALDALPAPEFARPAHIGPYRIVREIGRGGMGVVYEGIVDSGSTPAAASSTRAAIKVLPLGVLSSPRALERFRREAAALARISSPNIVAVRGSGTHAGTPWLAMELIEGESLSAATFAGRSTAAARAVRDLARAVAACHEAGVLHRDVKPQNVRLRPDGTPVLLDFGLAVDAEDGSLTSTGDVLGTPAYLAPEQALGRAADERSDVHGLGLLLFELLAGRPARGPGGRTEMLLRIARGAPPRGRDLLRAEGRLPAPLVAVVERSLAWNPRRRYATASALADDIDRFLAGAPVRVRRFGPVTRWRERFEARPAVAAIAALAFALALSVAWMTVPPAIQRANAERRVALDRAADLATFLWLRGDADAAERVAALLDEDAAHAEARALSEQFAGRAPSPESLVAALAAAGRAEKDGQVDVAARLLDDATRSHSGSLALAEARSANFLRRRAYSDAVTWTRLAIDRAGDDAELWHRLARALRGTGSLDEALEAARRAAAIAADGADPAITNTLAVLFDQTGDKSAARELWSGLLARHPEKAQYAFNVAFSLDSEGRPAEALPHYENCLQVDPGLIDAVICVAWIRAGAADPDLRDPDRAESLLLDAIARDRGASAKLLKAVVDVGRKLDDVERTTRLAAALERLTAEDGIDARRLGEIESARRSLTAGSGK